MASTKEHPLEFDEDEHARNILRKLNAMRREEKNCDLIISVEEKKIHVNRDVMCAASDYFDAMFFHDTKEKQEGIVEMKDVHFTSVEKCIEFIYTGKLAVSEDQCENLLYTASLMQLKEVCDKISPFLVSRLSSRSFFNIRRIAIKFSLESLTMTCDEFALDHLFALAKQQEFNDLDLNYVSYLLSSCDSTVARMEDLKLTIALQWIKADLENREKYLVKIIGLIDTTKVTSGYSKFLVEKEPLCSKSAEFIKMLFLGNPAMGGVLATGPPDLSALQSSLILFDKSSKLVQLYQPSKNQLNCITDYHQDMDNYFTSCIMKDDLFVFTWGQKVFRINITSSNPTWDQLNDMLHDHRSLLRCTVSGNFVYVGGNDLMERCRVLEEGRWEDVDIAGNSCRRSALIDYEGFVFVIGGGKEIAGNTVRKFSPSSSSWSSVTSMHVSRANPSAAVHDCVLYVAGGFNDGMNTLLRVFEMYDHKSGLWTILEGMNTPRSLFGLCIVNNQIFAVGNGDECSIEVYDSSQRNWLTREIGPTMNIYAVCSVSNCTNKQ